jgi:thiol-disulfide isomerase/thioredoxin
MKKQIKKNIKKRKDEAQKLLEEYKSPSEIMKFVYVFTGVLIFIFIVYLLTNFFVAKKDEKKPDDKTPTVNIQYYEILAGQVFNRKYSEYYVLFDKTPCSKCVEVEDLLYEYNKESENSIKYFLVDMQNKLNEYALYDWEAHYEKYGENDITARINKTPKNAKELQIANFPTLLKIKNGKVVLFLDDYEKIIDYIESLN